jgi:hypothetical protein
LDEAVFAPLVGLRIDGGCDLTRASVKTGPAHNHPQGKGREKDVARKKAISAPLESLVCSLENLATCRHL